MTFFCNTLQRAPEFADRYAIITYDAASGAFALVAMRANLIGAKRQGDMFVARGVHVIILDRRDLRTMAKTAGTHWVPTEPPIVLYDILTDEEQIVAGHRLTETDAWRKYLELTDAGIDAIIRCRVMLTSKRGFYPPI